MPDEAPGRVVASHRIRLIVAEAAGRLRGRHLLALDTIGIALSAYLALAFRNLATVGPGVTVWIAVMVGAMVAIRTAIDMRAGLYFHDWRFASVPDMVRIVVAVGGGTLIAAALVFLVSLVDPASTSRVPLTFWPIEMLLTMTVVGGIRFGIRAAFDMSTSRTGPGLAIRPALLYGAGRVGVIMARSAQRMPSAGVRPVGFLDDDPRLVGTTVSGLRVLGDLDALAQAAERTGAQMLLITASNATGPTIRRIVDAATALHLEVRTVPSMVELLDGTVDAHRVRKVRVEDLLRRPTTTEHGSEVAEVFPGKVVLITGAGGSIGSELARQVMALRPRRLILLDRAESALFDIHRELHETFGASDTEVAVQLANVASRMSITRIVDAERPDVILHAAAYKHVPMMEKHPADAVYVNIAGTMALLDAAAEAGVERFVLVSTDKAVRPSSVMGASKRVAEMLVADAARRTGRAYVAVRFGNVLGSNGSVVPIFTSQLERGRPLTITHPEMTRYFMTIPEASWLILDAAALGRAGDLFVLDMGEPIKIVDLARDVIRLAGRDSDWPIETIGLRPGEKLHEELFYDAEEVQATSTPKVLRAVADPPPTDIRAQVGRLLDSATSEHDDELRTELAAIVGGIQAPTTRVATAPLTTAPIAIPVLSGSPRMPVAVGPAREGA